MDTQAESLGDSEEIYSKELEELLRELNNNSAPDYDKDVRSHYIETYYF